MVWSALSLVALLGGIGIMFAIYGRWSQKLGWHGDEMASTLSFREPGEVPLTPAQRSTIWFFAIVSVLFLAQALVGAAAQHYRADLSSFFGLDLARFCPTTWLAPGTCSWRCFGLRRRSWPAASSSFHSSRAANRGGRVGWLTAARRGRAGGVRLADHRGAVDLWGDPRRQLALQQWEYLDLPRLWQILLIIGMFLWIAIIWRACGRDCGASRRLTCRGCFSSRAWRSPCSTRSGCWPAATPTSRSPISGGSGWCTCG
ncbi:nitric oxide reductase domain protein [Mycobacterium xenopi 4042]|uniref:Nitric oxide reductase domain protein n=1 Tax=Mycobacterium xenopi 4042 TaxID=1299334 RepID=X8E063_MYCXE|nr:nitric oxide reductase domain protein [Mycobacterium xenopi 4042]